MQVRTYVTALRVQGAAAIACAEGTMKSKRATSFHPGRHISQMKY